MELQFASAEISSEQSPTGYCAQSHQGLEMHHRFLQFCSFACGSAALRFFTRRRPPRVINQTVPLPREGEDNASPTRHGRMHGSLPPQKRGRGCVSRVLPISPLIERAGESTRQQRPPPSHPFPSAAPFCCDAAFATAAFAATDYAARPPPELLWEQV